MANTYEEKLGTEKMLPLILKMALPSVAAQLVNLLYSIVDRIYGGCKDLNEYLQSRLKQNEKNNKNIKLKM